MIRHERVRPLQGHRRDQASGIPRPWVSPYECMNSTARCDAVVDTGGRVTRWCVRHRRLVVSIHVARPRTMGHAVAQADFRRPRESDDGLPPRGGMPVTKRPRRRRTAHQPVAPWRAVYPEWDARSRSSRCDSPSLPSTSESCPSRHLLRVLLCSAVALLRCPTLASPCWRPYATVAEAPRHPLRTAMGPVAYVCASPHPGDGHRSAPEHRTQSIHATQYSWQAPPASCAPRPPPPRGCDPLMRAPPPG
jgi:hypothetical protein